MPSDDLQGIIGATALPYAANPWDPIGGAPPPCSDCPHEWYGKGRVNPVGAVEALTQYSFGALSEYSLHLGSPGATLDSIDTFTITGQQPELNGKWTVFQMNVPVHGLPPLAHPDLPRYVAWANQVSSAGGVTTTTRMRYFRHTLPPTYLTQAEVARCGITAAVLGPVDQNGSAVATGYVFRRALAGVLEYWPPVSEARIQITALTGPMNPASVQHGGRAGLRIVDSQVSAGGDAFLVQLLGGARGTVKLEAFDVAGRRMGGISVNPALTQGRDVEIPVNNGKRVPGGVYFVTARQAATEVTRKLVVVR